MVEVQRGCIKYTENLAQENPLERSIIKGIKIEDWIMLTRESHAWHLSRLSLRSRNTIEEKNILSSD